MGGVAKVEPLPKEERERLEAWLDSCGLIVGHYLIFNDICDLLGRPEEKIVPLTAGGDG
jgi:hypothetical protein